MADARLHLLSVAHAPPSPPRTGAQRRMHGLLSALGRRHDVSVVTLAPPGEVDEVERALRAYCREVIVVPRAGGATLASKRARQLRSLVSPASFERLSLADARLLAAARSLADRSAFDVVAVETPFLFEGDLRRAPPGRPLPLLLLDEHNVEYDILRQVAGSGAGLLRRAYNALDWRKVRREEHAAWRAADGVLLTSGADEARVRAEAPGARTAVVPNAADVDHFRPRAGDPPADGRTILFFGALSYFPNTEGVLHFLRHVWPALAAERPELRLKIVGPQPPAEILASRGPRVEVTGFVDDLRPHLAAAAVLVVPLRIGGGTRLKILEALAMARPIVSTRLGAEGIAVTDGVDILLADEPAAFAAAIRRVLDDPARAAGLGRRGRALVEAHYSWEAAAGRLEDFVRALRDPARAA